MFGCKVPEDILKKLDKLTNNIAEMKHAVTMPTASFSFSMANSIRPSGIKARPLPAITPSTHLIQAGTSQETSSSRSSGYVVH